MAAPSYSTTIATLPTSSAVDSHAFTIASDVANAQTSAAKYTISEGHINADPKNNNIVINEITIERNGRKHTYTLPKDAAIGHWKDNAFSVDDTAMKKILVEAVKDDDKKIKEYEKNLSQVTAAANGTDRYVYAAKDGTYIINISATKDSYTIKDLNGNEVDAGKEVKGGNVQDVVREALHTLKDDIKVSSEPVDAKEWLKSLANNAEGLKLQFDNNAYDGRAPSISVNAKATAPTTQFEKKQADGLAMS